MSDELGWNPYFVAYAAANGLTPAEQAAVYKGHQFIVWINEQWRTFEPDHHDGQQRDHDGFQQWLQEQTQHKATA